MILEQNNQIFICFAAEDRYRIVEPIVYHLNNYGINTWYDRFCLLLGDDRVNRNLIEGAQQSKYVLAVISPETDKSPCAMEELSIIETRYRNNCVVVFPILYEMTPDTLPDKLLWVKSLIFKETDRKSGTREICNHIACKITEDLLLECKYKTIHDCLYSLSDDIPLVISEMLSCYLDISQENLNSRVTLLYSCYLVIKYSLTNNNAIVPQIINSIFSRLFAETKLCLAIDYRELWLLENALCLLINFYMTSRVESKI